MDIEELRAFGASKEHYVFIDSNDARFAQASGSITRIENGVAVTYTDSSASRVTVGNPANGYTISFAEPFFNVVSVELMEAQIPSYPLRAPSQYDPINIASSDPLRYISLRCPDIEQHLSRHKQDINWPFGLARIPWATLTDDFVVYRKPYQQMRRFHPIGKLASMRLDFYKNNSDCHVLFKGFHHTLLLAITTLEPVMKTPEKFPLNPFYDPKSRETGYIRPDVVDESSEDEDLYIR